MPPTRGLDRKEKDVYFLINMEEGVMSSLEALRKAPKMFYQYRKLSKGVALYLVLD